jgi:hypothetical protein
MFSCAVISLPAALLRTNGVFDDPLLALAMTFPDVFAAAAAGAVRSAPDPDALAALIG